jgi:ketosteroid isomerase-like protein
MAQQPDPGAEIHALIERWATSVRAHDIEGVLAYHAPDKS